MKNKKTAPIFIAIILLFSLLISGCDEELLADVSDDHTDIHAPLLPADESSFPPLSNEPQGGHEGGLTITPEVPQEDETISGEAPRADEPPINDPPITDAPSIADAPTSGESGAQEETVAQYDTYTAACATSNVNVRSGAGTNYPILFTLKRGDSLPYLGKVGGWLKVTTERGVGYISSDYAYLAETSAAIEKVIRAGLSKLGTPYKWGAPRILTGEGAPSPYFTGKSFDCSSFVQYCYYVGCGVKLGNYTGTQADYTVGKKINTYSALRRGDFYFTGTDKISHVVIYLGGGYLLQTYSANGGPVSVTTDERWRGKFISGRRPDLTVIEQFR